MWLRAPKRTSCEILYNFLSTYWLQNSRVGRCRGFDIESQIPYLWRRCRRFTFNLSNCWNLPVHCLMCDPDPLSSLAYICLSASFYTYYFPPGVIIQAFFVSAIKYLPGEFYALTSHVFHVFLVSHSMCSRFVLIWMRKLFVYVHGRLWYVLLILFVIPRPSLVKFVIVKFALNLKVVAPVVIVSCTGNDVSVTEHLLDLGLNRWNHVKLL